MHWFNPESFLSLKILIPPGQQDEQEEALCKKTLSLDELRGVAEMEVEVVIVK